MLLLHGNTFFKWNKKQWNILKCSLPGIWSELPEFCGQKRYWLHWQPLGLQTENIWVLQLLETQGSQLETPSSHSGCYRFSPWLTCVLLSCTIASGFGANSHFQLASDLDRSGDRNTRKLFAFIFVFNGRIMDKEYAYEKISIYI